MNDIELLLREALDYVGASEVETEHNWEAMRKWHRTVSALLLVECEEWAEDECESS